MVIRFSSINVCLISSVCQHPSPVLDYNCCCGVTKTLSYSNSTTNYIHVYMGSCMVSDGVQRTSRKVCHLSDYAHTRRYLQPYSTKIESFVTCLSEHPLFPVHKYTSVVI